MVKKLLQLAVLKIKCRNITFDEAVRNVDLINLLFRSLVSTLRGLLRLRKLVLLGYAVHLRSKYNMNIGKGVTIGDHAILDALGTKGLRIGSSSSIGAFSLVKVSGSFVSIGHGIDIGKNVGIGEFAHIGGAGGVTIGDDTIIGAYLSVHPENHVFFDREKLIREQGVTRKGVVVGSNCWIGAKVTILDGSHIGNGCVIAAGAVVKGQFPDNVVIGGIPAKILKER